MKGKVLMFHRILPEELIGKENAYAIRGTLISREFFIQVLEGLKTRDVVSLEHFHRLQMERKATGNEIVLTFDDGYFDTWMFAAPLLLQFGYPATLFPVLGPCSTASPLPVDLYYHLIERYLESQDQKLDYVKGVFRLKFNNMSRDQQQEYCQNWLEKVGINSGELIEQPLYMSMENLQAWVNAGFTLGGHSERHGILPTLTDSEVIHELAISQGLFRMQPCASFFPFAYPDGQYDSRILQLTKKVGYHMALTVEKKGLHSYLPFEVPRLFVCPSFDLKRL